MVVFYSFQRWTLLNLLVHKVRFKRNNNETFELFGFNFGFLYFHLMKNKILLLPILLAVILSSCSKEQVQGTYKIQSANTTVKISTADMQGDTLTVIYKFEMAPDWHIYWQNPGESGLPPEFKWNLPGLEPIDIQWPAPRRYGNEQVMSYGMGGVAYITQQLRWTSDAATLRGTLKVEWLECKEECIPQDGEVRVVLSKDVQEHEGVHWVTEARNQRPIPSPTMVRGILRDSLVLDLGLLEHPPTEAYFFTSDYGWFEPSAPQSLLMQGGRWRLSVLASNNPPTSNVVSGVIQFEYPDRSVFYSVDVPIVRSSQNP
jgi:DsbC/DsbD-like thiol-disulfide interchange protein